MFNDPIFTAPRSAIIEQLKQATPANYEEYVIFGQLYREAKDNIQWELGRLAYELTKDYDPKAGGYVGLRLIDRYANDIGIDRKTLERYRRVYRVFKIENKFVETHLSFTHYAIASKMEQPTEWLLKAADNEWTVAQFVREIAISQGKAARTKDFECPHCHEHIQVPI